MSHAPDPVTAAESAAASAVPRVRGSPPRQVRVAIVGSGFGGLCAATRLKQQGRDDFVVSERAATLGGTWRDKRYPGAACDVPSHLYSYSFAPSPHWTRWYSCQHEIREYLARCADVFRVRDHVRYGHDVQRLAWDDAAGLWRITTSQGEWTAQFVVAAPGPLAEPKMPPLPGSDRYEGRVFHTARWPDDLELAGRRVAVIGTGASATWPGSVGAFRRRVEPFRANEYLLRPVRGAGTGSGAADHA